MGRGGLDPCSSEIRDFKDYLVLLFKFHAGLVSIFLALFASFFGFSLFEEFEFQIHRKLKFIFARGVEKTRLEKCVNNCLPQPHKKFMFQVLRKIEYTFVLRWGKIRLGKCVNNCLKVSSLTRCSFCELPGIDLFFSLIPGESKWDFGNVLLRCHLGDTLINSFFRTPGSLPSANLSFSLSLCKNTMTSANRRVNSSILPTGGYPGRLPRHSTFIFTPSPFPSTTIGPPFLSIPPESKSPLSLLPPYLFPSYNHSRQINLDPPMENAMATYSTCVYLPPISCVIFLQFSTMSRSSALNKMIQITATWTLTTSLKILQNICICCLETNFSPLQSSPVAESTTFSKMLNLTEIRKLMNHVKIQSVCRCCLALNPSTEDILFPLLKSNSSELLLSEWGYISIPRSHVGMRPVKRRINNTKNDLVFPAVNDSKLGTMNLILLGSGELPSISINIYIPFCSFLSVEIVACDLRDPLYNECTLPSCLHHREPRKRLRVSGMYGVGNKYGESCNRVGHDSEGKIKFDAANIGINKNSILTSTGSLLLRGCDDLVAAMRRDVVVASFSDLAQRARPDLNRLFHLHFIFPSNYPNMSWLIQAVIYGSAKRGSHFLIFKELVKLPGSTNLMRSSMTQIYFLYIYSTANSIRSAYELNVIGTASWHSGDLLHLSNMTMHRKPFVKLELRGWYWILIQVMESFPVIMTMNGRYFHKANRTRKSNWGRVIHFKFTLPSNCPSMPSNAAALKGRRTKGFDPSKEAATPIPNEVWERQVNRSSLKPKKRSDVFKIPKTGRQSPHYPISHNRGL